jgi:hypothetical protein
MGCLSDLWVVLGCSGFVFLPYPLFGYRESGRKPEDLILLFSVGLAMVCNPFFFFFFFFFFFSSCIKMFLQSLMLFTCIFWINIIV